MTVSDALARSNASTLMHKSSVKTAQNMIFSNEDVVWATITNVYVSPVFGELSTKQNISNVLAGVLVVTDQRILFVNNVLGRGITKEVPLSDIRSIDSKAGDIFESIRIASSVDMIVLTNTRHIILSLRNAISEAITRRNIRNISPQYPAPTLQASDISQLQALKQLYDAGVITAEEFAAKKAQILKI